MCLYFTFGSRKIKKKLKKWKPVKSVSKTTKMVNSWRTIQNKVGISQRNKATDLDPPEFKMNKNIT